MRWADIKTELTKDSVRKKERLALFRSIESAWNTGGTDQVEEWLLEQIEDTITHAKSLQRQLVGNRESKGEEDTDENED